MEELKNAGISILTVVLSALIKLVTMAIQQPAELKSNPKQVYGVGFEFIMVALSILLGSYFSSKGNQNKRAKLFIPMVTVFIMTIISFASISVSLIDAALITMNRDFIIIWLPNILGFASIGLSVRAARG